MCFSKRLHVQDCDEDCEGVAKALVDLARELDAGMLFLVNNSDSHLEDFLHHSVTGQCLLKGSCPAVILHANKHEFGTDMEL